MLLALRLIVWGILPFIHIPYSTEILAILAIAAGILLLLDR